MMEWFIGWMCVTGSVVGDACLLGSFLIAVFRWMVKYFWFEGLSLVGLLSGLFACLYDSVDSCSLGCWVGRFCLLLLFVLWLDGWICVWLFVEWICVCRCIYLHWFGFDLLFNFCIFLLLIVVLMIVGYLGPLYCLWISCWFTSWIIMWWFGVGCEVNCHNMITKWNW